MKIIFFAFLVSVSSGCASQKVREFNPRMCNKNAAYEIGYNDGRDHWAKMNSEFLNDCRDDLRLEAQNGYRDGYLKGQEERTKQQETQRKIEKEAEKSDDDAGVPIRIPSINSGTQINVNIGGFGKSGSQTSRAWYCTAEAFMSKFEGFGPTEIEARRAAVASCKTKYHQMHCDDVDCQLNK